MDVALQYLDGCPHWQVADGRVLEALRLSGRDDTEVDHQLVSTPEEAAAVGFRGSPTLLIDGVDPFADPDAPVGLSCRVYRTDTGLAGSPTVEQLLAVLT
ncbi:alkylmercury lyase [Geodermatophilus sp. Leaf369]|uniref:hypothetical protein n=1 Tax=Geodermatophilus sp. Leaf369 TaxID=1736354 RepID=UPI0006FC008D|nr:hypothetical protein [Geodermatophilus sp. Leaf369]KQS54602.1 alkylmercury lyase [Geodermatophilus sp. Leaf369]